MNRVGVILVVSTACLTRNLISSDRCCEINSRQLPYYKLIRSNARSNQVILSRTTVANVNECKEFALAKKALAFNYGLETDRREWNFDTRRKRSNRASKIMCQALECPEIHHFTTFVKDKNYKYYSMYPNNVSIDTNFTLACIPRTGIFVFSSNNLNYSQAQISCQKMNASLAHVISEERTNGLARYISENAPTFVGLSNRDHENIWKNEFDRRRMNLTHDTNFQKNLFHVLCIEHGLKVNHRIQKDALVSCNHLNQNLVPSGELCLAIAH
ncbi:uncharacterized protein LOC128887214 isoform X2 [Hylaeus anthracinus]|uniref:uncharacterized protein LOC128887214 isoform X2 n=1 Tax=Hylaeus anthracinus TaxID=313031 RepID=UPI0023B9101F|nr:uncharacterized protein LOC128887214 isoform X2 [Hylaeus anthracinus]